MSTYPRKNKHGVPHFDQYTCPGDWIEWKQDDFDMRCTLDFDPDTDATQEEWLSPVKVAAWKRDEWFFGYIHVTASKCGVELADGYLCGIDVNYDRRSNTYLSEAAYEVAFEVIQEAKDRQKELACAFAA